MLNDFHYGACGGHLSSYATMQKILHAGYFWPTIFRDCILAVRSCHACHIYDHKICKPPAPMHPTVSARPFTKLGINFMTCNPPSSGGAWLYYCRSQLFYQMGKSDAYIMFGSRVLIVWKINRQGNIRTNI